MADYKNEFGEFAERPKVEKKFYDCNKVVAGLLIFFALITLPLWQNLGKTVPAPEPKLDTPAIQKLAQADRKCILPTPEMRSTHMRMLIDWRDTVVRSKEAGTANSREFVTPDGKKYLASLTNTCMECHSNKVQFCDQCHNYVAVAPNCWGCHLEKGKTLAEAK